MAEAHIPRTALVVGILALFPFAAALAAGWALPDMGHEVVARRTGLIYAALMLSFFGGIRWGACLGPVSPRRASQDFALSVVPQVVGWLSLLMQPLLALCVLLALHLLQALWDVIAVERGRLPYWYGKLRMAITVGAVAAILVMLGERIFFEPLQIF